MVRRSGHSQAMRDFGFHKWTKTSANNQQFWCKCQIGKDHKSEPRFE